MGQQGGVYARLFTVTTTVLLWLERPNGSECKRNLSQLGYELVIQTPAFCYEEEKEAGVTKAVWRLGLTMAPP